MSVCVCVTVFVDDKEDEGKYIYITSWVNTKGVLVVSLKYMIMSRCISEDMLIDL